jgi:putative transposase
MIAERGSPVDHSNLYRWVQKFTPKLESAFRKSKKRTVGKSWRMDATYIKINGQWKYLYHAVDKNGQTTDCLLTPIVTSRLALRFFKKAVWQHDLPDKVTIDKSGAKGSLEALKEEIGR